MSETTERPDSAPAPSEEPYLGPPAQGFVAAITTVVIAFAILAVVVIHEAWPAIERAFNCH